MEYANPIPRSRPKFGGWWSGHRDAGPDGFDQFGHGVVLIEVYGQEHAMIVIAGQYEQAILHHREAGLLRLVAYDEELYLEPLSHVRKLLSRMTSTPYQAVDGSGFEQILFADLARKDVGVEDRPIERAGQ